MRRSIPVALGAAAILAGAATVASGHDVTGDAVCYVNSTGHDVIGAHLLFTGFTSDNKPVGPIDVTVDHVNRVHVTSFTFPGADGQWPAEDRREWIDATPGAHDVFGTANWPGRGDRQHSFTAKVDCPTPSPTPTPKPTPTPRPPVTPTPTPTPAPPPPHRHHPTTKIVNVAAAISYLNQDPAHATRAGLRIVVKHPGAKHGLQTFRARTTLHLIRGSLRWRIGRHLTIVNGRLHGGRLVPVRNARPGTFTWSPPKTRIMRTFLFDQAFFTRANIFGTYDVGVQARAREAVK